MIPGFHRPANDNWMSVIPTRHRNISHYVQPQRHKHHDINPYDILRYEEFQNHNEIILPNGESIFSTFETIDELFRYMIHIQTQITPTITLVPPDKNNIHDNDTSHIKFTHQQSYTCKKNVVSHVSKPLHISTITTQDHINVDQ